MKIVYIAATTIPDAWFQAVYKVLESGFDYTIQHGSYIGSKRLEFDYITLYIKYPQARPLEPKIPSQYNLPDPVAPGYIEEYVPKLMTPDRAPNEDYTYGERLVKGEYFENRGYWIPFYVNQIEHFIKVLKETPNTNQACLQVAAPPDCLLGDPPCLRHIDMRIKDGKLIFYLYFRSWDLWNGFPANLGGIVYLQEYMASEIGVNPGPFVCASKGLHIYDYVWELAEIVRGKTIEEFRKGG